MTFERLIWQSALRNKRRSLLTALCVAFASVGFVLFVSRAAAPGALAQEAAVLGLLLSIGLTLLWSCWSDLCARAPADAVLFSLGFSRQQLATLLVMESVLLGGSGALVGVGASVALHAELGSLRIVPETLSLAFVAALVASALGAAWPAYRLSCSELCSPTVHDEFGPSHERRGIAR